MCIFETRHKHPTDPESSEAHRGEFGSDNFASRCLLDKKFQIFVGPFWTCKLRVFGISKILKSPKITNFSKNRPNPTWITKKWSVLAFVSLESRPKFRKKFKIIWCGWKFNWITKIRILSFFREILESKMLKKFRQNHRFVSEFHVSVF